MKKETGLTDLHWALAMFLAEAGDTEIKLRLLLDK